MSSSTRSVRCGAHRASSRAVASLVLLAQCALASSPGIARAEPATPPPRMVHVHIESNEVVALERLDDGWTHVCFSPCDRDVPVDADYRVNADGVRRNDRFRIAAPDGAPVTLHVETASAAQHETGVVFVALGLLTAAIGGLALAYEIALKHESDAYYAPGAAEPDPDQATPPKNVSLGPGAVTLAVSGVALLTGFVLLASNGRTTIDQVRGAPEPEAAKRRPIWHENPLSARAPRMTALPIVKLAF